MTYELARQLKDAGFPQKDEGNFYCGGHTWYHDNEEGEYEECPAKNDVQREEYCESQGMTMEFAIYIPTLSELIEACTNLTCLKKTVPERGSLRPRWIAEAWPYLMDAQTTQVQSIGDTPEEAVARLWLALNKK